MIDLDNGFYSVDFHNEQQFFDCIVNHIIDLQVPGIDPNTNSVLDGLPTIEKNPELFRDFNSISPSEVNF